MQCKREGVGGFESNDGYILTSIKASCPSQEIERDADIKDMALEETKVNSVSTRKCRPNAFRCAEKHLTS